MVRLQYRVTSRCRGFHALDRGEKLLLFLFHCGAGRGRTGTFAAALLCKLGLLLKAALKMVAAAGSGPETEEQRSLVEKVAASPDFGTLGLKIGDELEGPKGARATVASGVGRTLRRTL